MEAKLIVFLRETVNSVSINRYVWNYLNFNKPYFLKLGAFLNTLLLGSWNAGRIYILHHMCRLHTTAGASKSHARARFYLVCAV
jgi:hypothetical protein